MCKEPRGVAERLRGGERPEGQGCEGNMGGEEMQGREGRGVVEVVYGRDPGRR